MLLFWKGWNKENITKKPFQKIPSEISTVKSRNGKSEIHKYYKYLPGLK